MKPKSNLQPAWRPLSLALSLSLPATPVLAQYTPPTLIPGVTIPTGYPNPPVCNPVPPYKPAPPHHSADALPYRPFPATWQKTLDSFKDLVPGAVIIVKSPDWGVRVGVVGYADLNYDIPMSPELQFRVGSVTKFFVGQALLRLEQEGKLKLTDPIMKYLGDNKLVAGIPNIDKITVSDVMAMKSGIADYLGDTTIYFSPQTDPQKHYTADDLITPLSKNAPKVDGLPLAPTFAPGATYPNPYYLTVLNTNAPAPPTPPAPAPYPWWYYSNSNYILAGMLGEKLTGEKPEVFLKRYVFDPAGLSDTYFATNDRQQPATRGYSKTGAIRYPEPVFNGWCDVTAIDPSYGWTAGAIISTPWDLLKLEDTVFETDKMLNPGTKNKWYTFSSSDIHPGWEPMQYGVGALMQPERLYGTARGHGGAFPGYKALVYYFFDQKTSFILATNTWDNEYEVNMLDQIMPQVSSAVTTPRPHETAQLSHGRVTVGWQAGRIYGDSYNVYWGTNAAAVDRASEANHPGVALQTVKGTDAQISALPGKTYYWRVDTVAPGASLKLVIGPLWKFAVR
jgi:D-alanyl-D-alanine carboxypeptidase